MDNRYIKATERSVFTSGFRDGSLEAATGIMLLQLRLAVLLSRAGHGDLQSAVIALAAGLGLLGAVFTVRRLVVGPLLGRAKFLPQRRRQLSRFAVIPTIALISSALLTALLARDASPAALVLGGVIVSFTPIAMFTAAAYFLSMNRLYLYGALVGLVLPLGKYLELVSASRLALPATLLTAAGIFLAVAVALLAAFVRAHSRRQEQQG